MENNQNLPTEEVKVENNNSQNTNVQNDPNTKLYKILSYIGILWLVGLIVPDVKDNKSVKFHVGQGMLLTIAGVGLNMIVGILNVIVSIFVALIDVYALSILVSAFFGILYGAVSIGTLVLMIMGIMNANNGKDEPLPVIGKFAFYK